MAAYKIIVDFKGGQGGDGYKSQSADSFSSSPDAQQNAQFDKLVNSPFTMIETGATAFANIAAVGTVAAIGMSLFSHETQRIGRYTGSQRAQDMANATLSIISKIANPIGAIINAAYESDERQYQRTWESIGIQLDRERGGASLNRSR